MPTNSIGGRDGARASITAHQMQKLLETGTDRASVLSRFVDGLDADAEQILRDLLAAHPTPRQSGTAKSSKRRTK